MKKLLTLIAFAVLALPSAKTLAQITNNDAAVAQVYNELVRVQGKEMSKEEEERLLKTIPDEIRTKLEEVKKLDKAKYFSLLRQAGYLRSYLAPMEFDVTSPRSYASDSKLYLEQHKKKVELEINVEYLALKYKNSEANEKQNLKKELSESLIELFDIREAEKLQELKNLEKRLAELKESLQARKQNKNEIVQRRIQEMLGDSKYLRWE